MLDYLGDVVGGEVKVGGAHDVLQAEACDLIGHIHMELHLWRCGCVVCGGVVCDSVWSMETHT